MADFFDGGADEAARYYQASAEKGNPDAPVNLALCLNVGEGSGAAADKQGAVGQFRLAAEQGHHAAQFALGCCLRTGEGVERDPVDAMKWFQR